MEPSGTNKILAEAFVRTFRKSGDDLWDVLFFVCIQESRITLAEMEETLNLL